MERANEKEEREWEMGEKQREDSASEREKETDDER